MAFTEAALEKTLEGAYQTVLLLDELHKIPLPVDVEEAVLAEWGFEAAVLGLNKLEIYNGELRNRDRQRCISLRLALAIVDQFEDDLLMQEIVSPAGIIGGRIGWLKSIGGFLWGNARLIWDAIWALLKAISANWWDAVLHGEVFLNIQTAFARFKYEVMAIIFGIVAGAVGIYFAAVNVGGVSGNIRGIVRLTNAAALAARKKALPQRSEARKFRRKVSRL